MSLKLEISPELSSASWKNEEGVFVGIATCTALESHLRNLVNLPKTQFCARESSLANKLERKKEEAKKSLLCLPGCKEILYVQYTVMY